MLNGFGEGEAYNDLGAGSEADLSVSKQMNLIFVISGQKWTVNFFKKTHKYYWCIILRTFLEISELNLIFFINIVSYHNKKTSVSFICERLQMSWYSLFSVSASAVETAYQSQQENELFHGARRAQHVVCLEISCFWRSWLFLVVFFLRMTFPKNHKNRQEKLLVSQHNFWVFFFF